MNKHTYDYGLIGNCAYLALIGRDTNISWMCWPRFDSSFIFGSLLDSQKGGEFSVRPSEPKFSCQQYYIENTNVLCTEIENEHGRYRVTDFAPRFQQYQRYYKPLMFIRKIEPLSGTPRVKVYLRSGGDYGSYSSHQRRRAATTLRFWVWTKRFGLPPMFRLPIFWMRSILCLTKPNTWYSPTASRWKRLWKPPPSNFCAKPLSTGASG